MANDDFAKKAQLTLKRAIFAKEYAVDLNATQAAIRAGYSEKTAHSQGPRLLENVEVQHEVQEHLDAKLCVSRLTADRIIKEYEAMALVDSSDLYTEDGVAIPLKRLPKHIRLAVKEIKRNRDGSIDYVLWPKDKALEALAKYKAVVSPAVSGELDLAAIIEASWNSGKKSSEGDSES